MITCQPFISNKLSDVAVPANCHDVTEFIQAETVNPYPGAFLASLCSVNLELAMPGQVLDSNAETDSEGKLRWEFSAWDALTQPVEIYAECALPD